MHGTYQNLFTGLITLIFFVFTAKGSNFPTVYTMIHSLTCTTYTWNVTAGGIVSLNSEQGPVCSKDVFDTSIKPAYIGRINCTINSSSVGVTVRFCFYNITSSDSGLYTVAAASRFRNGTIYVMNKPTIPQISPTTVETGRQESLTCASTSTSTPSPTGQAMIYTWTVNNGPLSDSRLTSSGNKLTINTVRREDKDVMFQCTARENQGLTSDTTGIYLTVHYPPQGKPMMTYSTLTYITGSTVTLSCSITEDGYPQATWTWRCGSRTFNSGITNSVGRSNLTFVVTKTDHNQPCTCTASSTVGSYSQTSDPATLDIRYSPQGKPMMSYSTLTYITGRTVTLSCRITEDGNPQAMWTWRCGSRTFNSGITNSVGRSNLTFVVTKTDNNQPCTCTASSSVGSYSQTSDPATLDIQYPPQGKTAMSHSTLTYTTGSTVTLSCSITEDGNPQATWTWKCGSRTFNSGITNSVGRSNLTFVVTKTDNNQPCTCTASSTVGSYSQTSDPAILDIRYAPHGKPVMSHSTLAYITGSTVTLSCSITEDGNPQANWTWSCGSRFFNSGISNSIGRSNLTFMVNKTDNNQPCTCTASSIVGSYSQTSDPATLDIRYESMILSLSTSKQIIYENDNVSLKTLLDGNPSANVTWMNEDSKITLKTENTNNNTSVLRFERINCLDTATYKVTGFNGIGNADSRSINISALCPPRAYDANQIPQRVAVNDDRKLYLSFIYVGYPVSTVQWYFRRNETSSNKTLDMSMIFTETKKIGKVKYETTLTRNLTSDEFGEYFAVLTNTQGNVAIMFEVVSQGKPDPPTDLLIDCRSPLKARLYWISQFNGLGEMQQQQFSILFKMNGTGNFTNKKEIRSDTGWGKNLTGSVTLIPGDWIFKIEAMNEYGRTESVAATSCSVKANLDQSASSSLPVAAVAGGIVTFIALIAVIVVVILLRRKGLYAKKGSQYSSHKGPLVDDNSVDDGIKDNILYQSADEAIGKKTLNDNPSTLYAEVQKGTNKKNQSEGPSSLYAEVQKQGKKAKRGKGKQKTDTDGGMVYENVDPKSKQETSFSANGQNKPERGQKNQDGLLYIDVDIKPRTDGKRGIIIGEEDRTDYASVDFVFQENKQNE